jgi:hypothetical protein
LLEKENSLQRIENNTKQLKVGLAVSIIVLLTVMGIIAYYSNKKVVKEGKLEK